jgi:hypothetical protein
MSTGLCTLAKRLEEGHFAPPWERTGLTSSELVLFLWGTRASGGCRCRPRRFRTSAIGAPNFLDEVWPERPQSQLESVCAAANEIGPDPIP